MDTTSKKPWGYYDDHYREDDVVFKTIVVNPGEALSLQKHKNRAEFWFVRSGIGIFEDGINQYDLDIYRVKQGSTCHIPVGRWHRIENNGKVPLVIVEMQCGICDEDDIERAEDRYGRA